MPMEDLLLIFCAPGIFSMRLAGMPMDARDFIIEMSAFVLFKLLPPARDGRLARLLSVDCETEPNVARLSIFQMVLCTKYDECKRNFNKINEITDSSALTAL